MKTLPISRYRFFQKIQPLSLLKKITGKSVTGCLQVFSASGFWSLYIDEGKLIYACYSEEMFEPLYRNLQQLSQQVSTLPRGIHEQLRAIFETGLNDKAIPNPDYLAICWLVNQKYISSFEAGVLIEQLALEVLESFLKLEEGSYEFIPDSFLDDLPKFCHLNLRLLAEQCQTGSKVSPQQYAHSWQPKNEEQLQELKANQVTHNSYQPVYSQSTDKKLYRILSIVDSPIILNDIDSYLDEQIFSVIGVTDSSKALMEVLRIKPDLILLDVAMPNLNGYEVCTLLRKHTYFKKTPVIMMTGKTGLIDRAKAKMVRASGYLPKPFNQGDLLKIIFQHIV
ncbi:response regulator [Cylindrospermum sp. FACHB-282]|uniref:response regulator n=1 Tax=Cylindrospermum sp. FACHB-282 TaxID=2692794 RepID=UPI001683FE7D|nr:response regulator [Cylindrospermum sp. FACHB-282]MBD2386996.1 response regulator [Cylindrospermum sp. FACHB-282]